MTKIASTQKEFKSKLMELLPQCIPLHKNLKILFAPHCTKILNSTNPQNLKEIISDNLNLDKIKEGCHHFTTALTIRKFRIQILTIVIEINLKAKDKEIYCKKERTLFIYRTKEKTCTIRIK